MKSITWIHEGRYIRYVLIGNLQIAMCHKPGEFFKWTGEPTEYMYTCLIQEYLRRHEVMSINVRNDPCAGRNNSKKTRAIPNKEKVHVFQKL